MRTKEEILAEIEEDKARVRELHVENGGQYVPPDSAIGKEWEERNERIDENEKTIAQIEKREARIAELSNDPKSREDGVSFHTSRPDAVRGEDIYDLSTIRSSLASPEQQANELRSRAMHAVEQSRPKHPGIAADEAKANIERLIEDKDTEDARFCRYLLAVGSPSYRRAFGKYLARGNENGMSRDEQAAWHLATMAERALSLTGASGGFAVPFELDPTILNTSNGVVNPIRQIARVEQITVDEWRGLTAAGITASYGPEATEVGDNSPTIGQPTVSTEKAQAFVPFSIEIGQDWAGLQAQMATMLQEARDVLEAQKFTIGTGTNEPFGVLTGTTNTVNAAVGADAFTLANLYALKGALPPRYRNQASFAADSLIYDRIRQFDTGAQSTVWVDSLQDDNAPRLLGKAAYEASEMPDNATTGNKFLLYGDFNRYLVVDRVGMTIEVIPHLFGINRRPTGERGIYAYWRNGAKVLDANAFRALVGTA